MVHFSVLPLYLINEIFMIYNKLQNSFSKSKEAFLLHSEGDWKAYMFENIDLIKTEWKLLEPSNRQLLSYEVLKSIEEYPPGGMNFYYLLLEKADRLVGFSYFQLLDIDLNASIKNGAYPKSPLGKLRFRFKSFLRSLVNIEVLVVGNFLTSGDQSHHFTDPTLKNEGQQFLINASEYLLQEVSPQCKALRGVIFKDLLSSDKEERALFKENGFLITSFQPRMLFELRPEWQSFDDYLAAISSKYRVRIKKAKKRFKDIEVRELSYEEISQHSVAINKLFDEIISNVSFNALKIKEGHFANLKKNLGDQFDFYGFFKEDRFVGFYTIIHGEEELEAHYIGMSNADNKKYSLYFNLLLELTRIGIERGYKRVNFSRTAMEIKSSVGAVGQDLNVYYKHPNKGLQSVFIYLFRLLKPARVKWTPRSPFKKAEA